MNQATLITDYAELSEQERQALSLLRDHFCGKPPIDTNGKTGHVRLNLGEGMGSNTYQRPLEYAHHVANTDAGFAQMLAESGLTK